MYEPSMQHSRQYGLIQNRLLAPHTCLLLSNLQQIPLVESRSMVLVLCMYSQACCRWVSALKEDDVSVVLTGKLPSTSSPITIISFDLATRLGTELAQRRPDAIIVVSTRVSYRGWEALEFPPSPQPPLSPRENFKFV